MATLPTLKVTGAAGDPDGSGDAWDYSSNGGSSWTFSGSGFPFTRWDYIDDPVLDATADSDVVAGPPDQAPSLWVTLQNVPADFTAMQSLVVDARLATYGISDDTVAFYVTVFDSTRTVAYTNEVLVLSASAPVAVSNHSVAATLTAAGLAASRTDWDGATARLRWTYTRSKGGDGGRLGLSAIHFNGTYEAAATAITAVVTVGAGGDAEPVGLKVASSAVVVGAGGDATPAVAAVRSSAVVVGVGGDAVIGVAVTVGAAVAAGGGGGAAVSGMKVASSSTPVGAGGSASSAGAKVARAAIEVGSGGAASITARKQASGAVAAGAGGRSVPSGYKRGVATVIVGAGGGAVLVQGSAVAVVAGGGGGATPSGRKLASGALTASGGGDVSLVGLKLTRYGVAIGGGGDVVVAGIVDPVIYPMTVRVDAASLAIRPSAHAAV